METVGETEDVFDCIATHKYTQTSIRRVSRYELLGVQQYTGTHNCAAAVEEENHCWTFSD